MTSMLFIMRLHKPCRQGNTRAETSPLFSLQLSNSKASGHPACYLANNVQPASLSLHSKMHRWPPGIRIKGVRHRTNNVHLAASPSIHDRMNCWPSGFQVKIGLRTLLYLISLRTFQTMARGTGSCMSRLYASHLDFRLHLTGIHLDLQPRIATPYLRTYRHGHGMYVILRQL